MVGSLMDFALSTPDQCRRLLLPEVPNSRRFLHHESFTSLVGTSALLVVTSATLVVTGALLVVTRSWFCFVIAFQDPHLTERLQPLTDRLRSMQLTA